MTAPRAGRHPSPAWLASALLALLLLLPGLGGLARASALQELIFSHIDARQNLPEGTALCYLQDSQGLMWLGTLNGLARWDGRQMRVFEHVPERADTISHGRVRALLEQEGALWVGTARGVDRLDLATEQVRRLALPADLAEGDRRVVGIAARGPGSLWVATTKRLMTLDLKSLQFSTVPLPGLGTLRALLPDGQGALWVGHDSRVVRVSPLGATGPAFDLAAGPHGGEPVKRVVFNLALDAQRRLWVSTRGGMHVLALQEGQLMPVPLPGLEQLPRTNAQGLLRDRDGDIWSAYPYTGGLWRWRAASGQVQHFQHQPGLARSLASDSLGALYQDRSGALWVSSWGAGLSVADLGSRGFSSYQHVPTDADSLGSSDVMAVLPDGAEHVWVGSLMGAVSRLHLASGHTERFSAKEVGDINVKALAPDGRGGLWVGSEAGLFRFDPRQRRSVRIALGPEVPGSASIAALLRARDGELWAASASGIHRLGAQGWRKTYRGAAGGLVSNLVDCMLQDSAGRIWAGTKGGLHLYDEQTDRFRAVAQAAGASSRLGGIRYLFEASDGRLWVAHDLGLAELQMQGESVRLVERAAELHLPRGWVMSMLEDAQGRLWLCAEQGLVVLDLARRRVRLYPRYERHLGGGYGYGALTRMADGSLLFGSDGLLRVQPDLLRDNGQAPAVLLSDLRIFNRSALAPAPQVAASGQAADSQPRLADLDVQVPLHRAEHLRLGPDDAMVSFVFAATHYERTESLRYMWMLEGFDRDWVQGKAGESVATYTNLDPGRYLLRVKVANPDGVWSPQALTLRIQVLPPWWATWWARTLAVAALALALWTWHRRRTAALVQAQQQLEREVEARTHELLLKQAELQVKQEQLQDQVQFTERARRDITQLSEIGRELSSSLDARTVADILHKHVKALLPADVFGVGLVQWVSRTVCFDHLYEAGERKPPHRRSLDAPEQPASRCVLEAAELRIDSFEHDIRELDSQQREAGGLRLVQPAGQPRLRSGLYVPLQIKGRVTGVIAVLSPVPSAYDAHDQDILRTLAAYAAVALDNAEAHERLTRAQAQLLEQRKLASLGALVAGVAHELNTPIGNSLLVATTLRACGNDFLAQVQTGALKRSELTRFCSTLAGSCEVLEQSLERAAGLVRSFKQVSVDQTSEQRRRFPLRTVCQELAMTLHARMRQDGHQLTLDLPEEIELDSYPGPLGQVLSNLVINAIVHGFEGRQRGQMCISAGLLTDADGEEQVELVFSDNGKGIAPQHLEHVFDPFFTTRMGQGGTGLGLHISYNIVHQLLGGSIAVSSAAGAGARFTLRLPLVAPRRSASSLAGEGAAA